jgi:hypothetical protein
LGMDGARNATNRLALRGTALRAEPDAVCCSTV